MINWSQAAIAVVILAGGCSSGPQRVKPPKIDVNKAAVQAIELYDTNHDGKLSHEELANCPGVLAAFDSYDANHDKFVDQQEFHDHLAGLLKNGTGATQLACNVIYKGQPLTGAKVVFEPEPYLGNDIQTAEGVTTNSGAAHVGMPADKAPAALKALKLIQYGTYKVRITHPTIQLPAKYNTGTTLGYETIPGDPSVSFTLSDK
jgi:hypothetical protein